MTDVEDTPMALSWDPPGKGDWRGLHDHFPRALTAEYQRLLADGMTVGEAVWIERYGFPVRTIEPAFLHGRVFISAEPLVGPRTDATPPTLALRAALRLVPAFRRRVRAAELALAERPWLDEARRWFEVEQPTWTERNAALAAVEPGSLDDQGLITHLRDARALAQDGYRTHFRLHGCDLIPTGRLLARADDWELDPLAVASLLAGASPISRGDEPLPAWCLVTGYDLDDLAVVELPDRPALPARAPSHDEGEAVAAAAERLRSQVPATAREEWDELLADARATYGVRDANGLLTAAWPMGLLRRSMLEAGRRLTAAGLLDQAVHAVELTVDELVAALSGEPSPTAAEAAERLAERRRLSCFAAPPSLGPPQDLPLHALPGAMRIMAAALLAVRDHGTTAVASPSLTGVGIGDGVVRGRACVAQDPATALTRFEPGDIVVTAGTCPAWNHVLSAAGGVITEEGGPLSHAAIIARELALPALIGCTEAMALIPDQATIELDLPAGTVRVLPS